MEELEKNVGKVACFLGVIQGFAYAVLAIICVILYNVDVLNLSQETHMDIVNFYLYVLYLGPNKSIFTNQTLTPQVFAGFVWVYLILSLGWIGISIAALEKRKFLTFWSYLTFLICSWDLITVLILGADYQKCLNWVDSYFYDTADRFINQGRCASGILPVLVIAARGFILWVMNMAFASVLLISRRQLDKSPPSSIDASDSVVVGTASSTETGLQTDYPTLQYDSDSTYKQKPKPFNYTKPPSQQYPVPIPEPDYY